MSSMVMPSCPACGSKFVEKLRPVLVHDKGVLPSRLKTINRLRCTVCGFEGDEEMFLDESSIEGG